MKPVPFKQSVYLGLIQRGDIIDIIACDEEGNKLNSGYILSFYISDGKFRKQPLVNPDLGFMLDSRRRIVVSLGE